MDGRLLVGLIVWTPAPGMANATVSTVGEASPAAHSPDAAPEAVFVFAAVMAARSVQPPLVATQAPALVSDPSPVESTVKVSARADLPSETTIPSPTTSLRNKSRVLLGTADGPPSHTRRRYFSRSDATPAVA